MSFRSAYANSTQPLLDVDARGEAALGGIESHGSDNLAFGLSHCAILGGGPLIESCAMGSGPINRA